MKNYETLWKIIKIDVYQNLLNGIYDSTGHGVHNIIIYNIVLDITHFVGIDE